jgi:hypothetical protein
MNDFLTQLGKLSVGLGILVVVLLIVKALPALVNSFQRKDKKPSDSNNGASGDKSPSYWIRIFEGVVAPVLVKLEAMERKLEELLRRKR